MARPARIIQPDYRIHRPTHAEVIELASRRPTARQNRGRSGKKSGAASAAPSTPLTIISSTTVNMWLRSDLGVTDSGSGTAAAWDDQSPNNNDFLQGGASSIQPTINAGGPGGRPYLTLDGVDDHMISSFVPSATGWLWVITRRTSAAAVGYIFNASNTGSNRFSLPTVVAGPNLRMLNTTAGPSVSFAVGTWFRVWANYTGSAADELKVGSAAPGTGASAGSSGGLGGMWLGCTGLLASFYAGDILEVIHCAAKPSAGELTALDAYVTATWSGGVTV